MSPHGEQEAASWLPAILRDVWELALLLIGGGIAWIYRRVDTHSTRLGAIEGRLDAHDDRILATERHGEKIERIAEDVAYIRGRISKREGGGS